MKVFIGTLLLIIVSSLSLDTAMGQFLGWRQIARGDYVDCIAVEGDIIWAGTQVGLFKINGITHETECFNAANSPVKYNRVIDITIDNSGVKWFATSYRVSTMRDSLVTALIRYDDTDWTVFTPLNSPIASNDRITCIDVDANGVVWIGTECKAVFSYDGNDWAVYDSSNSEMLDGVIYSVKIQSGNIVWVASDQGLARYDGTVWTNFARYGGFTDIVIENDSLFWLSSRMVRPPESAALYSFDGDTFTPYFADSSGLPNDLVLSMDIDEDNVKWISIGINVRTGEKGLVRFDGENWEKYNTSNSGLTDDYVFSIKCAPNGKKLFGTKNFGIVSFDGDAEWETYETTLTLLPHNNVNTIEYNNEWLWVGTEFGLAKFNSNNENDEWVVFPDSILANGCTNISSIAFENEEIVWLCGSGSWENESGGVTRIEGSDISHFTSSNSPLPADLIYSIVVDNNGLKWIATSNGIACYNDESWVIYNTENSALRYNTVYTAEMDDTGTVWFGSEGGLVSFNGTDWQYYDAVGLVPITCLGFAPDGCIWIGTTFCGLGCFDGEDSMIVYHAGDSDLPDDRITDIEFYNDTMWVSTFDGLVRYYDNNWYTYNINNSGLSDELISCIAIDKETGIKYIGHSSGGISVYGEDANDILPEPSTIPSRIALSQNYPNPFNATTRILFDLPYQGDVDLDIYNVIGQLVYSKTIESAPAGRHILIWNSRDNGGNDVSSGIYFYRITTSQISETKKMVLMK